MQSVSDIELRLAQLERAVTMWRSTTLLSLAVVMPTLAGAGWYANSQSQVLRAKGLVIEDANGKARIVLGAPIPAESGRRRQDDTVGLVVLDANGVDRVQIGAPTPAPQVQGKVIPRIAGGAGILICDKNGNERGGFGYLDNDRVVLGMDYPEGKSEAVTLFVQDEYAGMMVHGEKARERGGIVFNNKEELGVFKLAGGSGWESLFWTVEKSGQPVLKTRKAGSKEFVDLLPKINF